MPNSSSNLMTSASVSSESSPRSSMKRAFAVTSPSSTPNSSTMIDFTLSSTEPSAISNFLLDVFQIENQNLKSHSPCRSIKRIGVFDIQNFNFAAHLPHKARQHFARPQFD